MEIHNLVDDEQIFLFEQWSEQVNMKEINSPEEKQNMHKNNIMKNNSQQKHQDLCGLALTSPF